MHPYGMRVNVETQCIESLRRLRNDGGGISVRMALTINHLFNKQAYIRPYLDMVTVLVRTW
jgi:hypothetical protein